jgi:hypothetical protein
LLRALAFDTILATTAAAGFGCGLVLAFIVIGGMR